MGEGIGMANTCKPMAVSFQCMTKFTTKKCGYDINGEVVMTKIQQVRCLIEYV